MPDSTREAAPGRAGVADAHADDVEAHALAAAALGDDPVLALAFWRARAEELAARLAQLERRMAALGARLPARWASLLTCDPADMPDVAPWPDPLAGWHETTELEQGRVASTLRHLWRRLDPDA